MPETGEQVEQPISILSEIGFPYVWIPYLIIDIYGPAMKEKGWLYTVLTRFKNSKDSKTFVGVRTLATTCGIHRDTVQEWARHLEKIGLIRIKTGDHTHSTEYTLLMPPMPPPPEILADHYPEGWEPPKRALKALENIRYMLGGYGTPQETTIPEGGVLNGRTGVPPNRTDRPNPAPALSQPAGHNNTFNNTSNKTNKQELPFVRSSLEKLKIQSPETTYQSLEDLYFKCLNLSGGDEEGAETRLGDGIKVVLQSKATKDPEALLWKAIENNWRPRPEPAPGSKSAPRAETAQDQARYEKKIEEDLRKEYLSASVESILTSYEFFKRQLKNSDPLGTIKKNYQGNPNLEKALELIAKGG